MESSIAFALIMKLEPTSSPAPQFTPVQFNPGVKICSVLVMRGEKYSAKNKYNVEQYLRECLLPVLLCRLNRRNLKLKILTSRTRPLPGMLVHKTQGVYYKNTVTRTIKSRTRNCTRLDTDRPYFQLQKSERIPNFNSARGISTRHCN